MHLSKLRNKHTKFYQILLLLSGDISLNTGPCHNQLKETKIWEPFKNRGLHFCHLNINSLFSKIDELREIANHIKPAIFGISELKLDSTVTNKEMNINGYDTIRCDRNRNGGGVACYIRNELVFNPNGYGGGEHLTPTTGFLQIYFFL